MNLSDKLLLNTNLAAWHSRSRYSVVSNNGKEKDANHEMGIDWCRSGIGFVCWC